MILFLDFIFGLPKINLNNDEINFLERSLRKKAPKYSDIFYKQKRFIGIHNDFFFQIRKKNYK